MGRIGKSREVEKEEMVQKLKKLRNQFNKRAIEVESYYEKYRNSERERKKVEKESNFYRGLCDERGFLLKEQKQKFEFFKKKILISLTYCLKQVNSVKSFKVRL